jgi:hypothetical protein
MQTAARLATGLRVIRENDDGTHERESRTPLLTEPTLCDPSGALGPLPDAQTQPLRERVAEEARRAGIDLPKGPMLLLTQLRYLGCRFNPVSFFYLFDRAGRLALVRAEVHNTLGSAHDYWLLPQSASSAFRSATAKSLYVSPFMPADLDYRFAVTPPADRLAVHMDTLRSGDTDGSRRPRRTHRRRGWWWNGSRPARPCSAWATASRSSAARHTSTTARCLAGSPGSQARRGSVARSR